MRIRHRALSYAVRAAEKHMKKNNAMTITQVAKKLGVVTKTIIRWEKSGKIEKAKRDYKGWRVYTKEEFERMKNLIESSYPA